MKNTTIYIYVRGGSCAEVVGDLHVATVAHSDPQKARDMAFRFINDDNQGNWLDWLSADDFYIEVEETVI